jgi:hypothetical protein
MERARGDCKILLRSKDALLLFTRERVKRRNSGAAKTALIITSRNEHLSAKWIDISHDVLFARRNARGICLKIIAREEEPGESAARRCSAKTRR